MIIDKSIKKECRQCNGKGYLNTIPLAGINECDLCQGTGKYKDEYYIIVANNIAVDSDNAGK